MEYQRVNEIFLEYLFLVRIYLVAEVAVLYKFKPNETKFFPCFEKGIYLRVDSVDKDATA